MTITPPPLVGGVSASWPPAGTDVESMEAEILRVGVLLGSAAIALLAIQPSLNKRRLPLLSMLIGCLAFGVLFVALQVQNFRQASSGSDGAIRGAEYFLAMGTHGVELAIGLVALLVGLIGIWRRWLPEKTALIVVAIWIYAAMSWPWRLYHLGILDA